MTINSIFAIWDKTFIFYQWILTFFSVFGLDENGLIIKGCEE
jgi:hypothetical protein